MKITEIPFNKFLKIEEIDNQSSALVLCFRQDMQNHIGTFHASGQFSLAEAASGLALQTRFAHLSESFIPVLRKTETKFRKPATTDISAKAAISEDTATSFLETLESKGRGLIPVTVEITDQSGNKTMTGTFEWFVQKIEEK